MIDPDTAFQRLSDYEQREALRWAFRESCIGAGVALAVDGPVAGTGFRYLHGRAGRRRQPNPRPRPDREALRPPTTDTDDEAETPASRFADTLLEVIASVDGQQVPSERALLAHVRLAGHRARNTTVRDALDDLLADGRLVEVQGKRGAKGYRATSTASHGPNPSESR